MSTQELSTAPKSAEREAKQKLALACRILGTQGHDDLNLGHLSARAPKRRNAMHMKGRGLCLSEIYDQDLVTIGFDYQKIEGRRDPHGELPIHVEIYRQRDDVNCIVHTHPLYATAFSATGQKLRPVNNEAVMFSDGLPYFDQVTDLIVTPELGTAVAATLGDGKAVIMKNHGIVVVGESIEQAAVRAYLLEKTIKTLFVASVFGEPKWTEDAEARQKASRIFTEPKVNAMWQALARQLEYRERPMRMLESIYRHLLGKSLD